MWNTPTFAKTYGFARSLGKFHIIAIVDGKDGLDEGKI